MPVASQRWQYSRDKPSRSKQLPKVPAFQALGHIRALIRSTWSARRRRPWSFSFTWVNTKGTVT